MVQNGTSSKNVCEKSLVTPQAFLVCNFPDKKLVDIFQECCLIELNLFSKGKSMAASVKLFKNYL